MRTALKPWQLYSLIAIATGLGLALVLKIFNPYPLLIDTDVIKEAIRIQYIMGHGYVGLFLPGTFRPLADDYLFAGIGIVFKVYASDLLWYATIFLYPLYALGVLYFAQGIFKDWPKSLMATVFAVLICGFWTLEDPAIVLPDEISIVVTLFFFAFYLRKNYIGTKQFFIFFSILLVINIGYYYTALIALPFFIFIQYWPMKRISPSPWIMFPVAIAILPIGFFLYWITIGKLFTPISDVEIVGYFNVGYTPLVMIFFVVGVALHLKKQYKHPSIIYSLLIIGIIFTLFPFDAISLRAEQFLRVNVAIVATAGVFAIAAKIPPDSRNKVKTAFTLLLICTPMLGLPYAEWATANVQVQNWDSIPFNAFDQNEGNAGLWLRNNGILNSSFIISDLSTSEIMQSMSGIPGVWQPIYFLNNVTLVNQIYLVLAAVNGSQQPSPSLSAISTNIHNFYIVISTRTLPSLSAWNHINFSNPIWFSRMFIWVSSNQDPPPKYSLKEVYSNSEVEILYVTN